MQLEVQKNQVQVLPTAANLRQRALAVADLDRAIAECVEQRSAYVSDASVVVDDQHVRTWSDRGRQHV